MNYFKIRTLNALSQINNQMYSLNNVSHILSRVFIQHILHLIKAAEINILYYQVTIA